MDYTSMWYEIEVRYEQYRMDGNVDDFYPYTTRLRSSEVL